MNRVGAKGKGESVWLGFFAIAVLREFEPLARERNDNHFADFCAGHVATLETKLAEQAWDGEWFLRAFHDNGQKLGSASNSECQIDLLPQAWAVIARAAEPERLRTALRSVAEHLIRSESKLIQLFDPPFDHGSLDPGYVKAYPPGIRENGGQYTHAAVWITMAYALAGDAEKAWECFQILCPPRHAASPEGVALYRVEPYVIPADIYSAEPYTGRGGWTWYTGSSGWMYQLILNTLLGISVERGRWLKFRPCPHPSWKSYKVHYRFGRTHYRIEFTIAGRPAHHVSRVLLDGQPQEQGRIELRDTGGEHRVEVVLGAI